MKRTHWNYVNYMNRTKEKSDFAAALARLLDETNLFTRSEWADLLGVSESAISQWTTDATIPRPEHLYMIFDTLKGSDVPEGPLDVFRKMASIHDPAGI